jgi:hypothetical protein
VFRQLLQWPLFLETEGVSVPRARQRDMGAIVQTVNAPGACAARLGLDDWGPCSRWAPLCSTRCTVKVIGWLRSSTHALREMAGRDAASRLRTRPMGASVARLGDGSRHGVENRPR